MDARNATYANRRRIKGNRGNELMRKRGELLERSFAQCYETGGIRRLHLRGRENIAKRVLIHAAGCNLGLLMRVNYGLRKPRSLSAAAGALRLLIIEWLRSLLAACARSVRSNRLFHATPGGNRYPAPREREAKFHHGLLALFKVSW
jgi:hypothetical protein